MSTTETTGEIPESGEIVGDYEGDLDVSAEKPSLSLQKADRSLHEFHRWYQRGSLIVDPEWQRHYIWNRTRASRLMESFLIDLPIPVIYLSVNDEGKYEVIDGLQRLTSIFDYFENKYKLTGLEILTDMNGKTFSELSKEHQGKLEDAILRTFELSKTAPKDLMFIIFERLNTGGITLNDMEIRNCLYRGRLNNLLKELSKNEDFLNCVNQKQLGKRMGDKMLVLRFLAFYQMTHLKAKKGLKAFFNEFFDTYRNLPEEKVKEFRRIFKSAMRGCFTVFGDKGFRLRRKQGTSGGEWTPRVNASIFQVVTASFTSYDIGAITRNADNIFEAYVDLTADDTWADCVQRSTGDPTRIEYMFEAWNERLKTIMKNATPNDSTRLFSRQLKEEMYGQDNNCEICGQKIVLINDAAIDHEEEYWRGGQSVPENARLVHRSCNMQRRRSR